MKLGRHALLMILLAPTLAAGTAWAAPGESAATIGFGEQIPMAEVKMKNVDGRGISIADVAGKKGTLVIFTCNACPWARAWEDRIARLGNRYQKRGVGVIAINPNDPQVVPADGYEQMKTRADEKGFRFPYVVDATSDVARAFGAVKTPEIFLFDVSGKLVYHGAVDDNARQPSSVERAYLQNALDALVTGGEIEVKESKAFGCSIKFRSAS